SPRDGRRRRAQVCQTPKKGPPTKPSRGLLPRRCSDSGVGRAWGQLELRYSGRDELLLAFKDRLLLTRSPDRHADNISPTLPNPGTQNLALQLPHPFEARNAGAQLAISDKPINVNAPGRHFLAVNHELSIGNQPHDRQIIRDRAVQVDTGGQSPCL